MTAVPWRMLPVVDLGGIEELQQFLGEFAAEVFASLKRKDQRGWGAAVCVG
ncbi:hypothetical protein [Streptomyces sp. NPDC007083]|uniref:hypothetical protein n=1 Tax=unclassified Streptomyces TaxID=2593676 RepID=UPI0033D0745E